jgi:hypothetical protein
MRTTNGLLLQESRADVALLYYSAVLLIVTSLNLKNNNVFTKKFFNLLNELKSRRLNAFLCDNVEVSARNYL